MREKREFIHPIKQYISFKKNAKWNEVSICGKKMKLRKTLMITVYAWVFKKKSIVLQIL